MLVGMFTEFNGVPCSGVVMLNRDGTVDPTFKLRKMEGGTANFATILNDHDFVTCLYLSFSIHFQSIF